MVRRGLALAAAGTLLGVLGAAGLTRFIRTLLHETAPLDPLTFGAAPLVLAIVSVAATAWGAARLDPNIALRSE